MDNSKTYKKESNAQNSILIEASNHNATLFRINVGSGWTGNNITRFYAPGTVSVNPGDVLINKARRFISGPPKGYHDLTGWSSVEITEEMVGKTVAVFTSVECKSEDGGATKEQLNFMDVLQKSGGRSGIAKTNQDAIDIINSAPWNDNL